LLIAVDVGGTKVAIASYENTLTLLKVLRTPKEPSELLDLLEMELSELEPSEVSIATMGPIDMKRGVIFNNPHLKVPDFGLGKELTERLGVPVYMVNDCSAGAWAEAKVRDEENLVYVGFGTGVGVGVVVDGHLLLGKDGNAHEFGHVKIALEEDLPCGCGGTGHVESFLGGSNLRNFAESLGFRVKGGAEFFKLVKENATVFNKFKKVLRAFLASLANAYDPETIVLGGGVYFKNKEVFEKALEGFEKDKDIIVRPPRVEPSIYDDLSPLYGAALLAKDKPSYWIEKLVYLVDKGG